MGNEFGERLKKIRKDRHMTQEELGAKCGACSGSVRSWEKGIQMPNAYYLSGICLALRVSADYLLGIEYKHHLRRNKCGERISGK